MRKTYGPTTALDGADFSIHPGEVVAVMGPSGSGKSTLLHCLAGIVTPDSGSITYDGQEMATMSDARRSALRRSQFGFVFQFGRLVPELTCVENVGASAAAERHVAPSGRTVGACLDGAAGGRRPARESAG